jgi:hypothetical protein
MSDELTTALQKSGLLDDLYANTKTREPLLHLMKSVRPDMAIPEIDTARAIAPEINDLRREVASLKLQNRYGMEADEVTEIAQLGREKGITNFDTAVEYARATAAARPRNSQASPVALPNINELFSSPAQWARNEAMKVMEENRRSRERDRS